MSHNLTLTKRGHPEVVLRQTPTNVTNDVLKLRNTDKQAEAYLAWVQTMLFSDPRLTKIRKVREWFKENKHADKRDFAIEALGWSSEWPPSSRWVRDALLDAFYDLRDYLAHEKEVTDAVRAGYVFGSV